MKSVSKYFFLIATVALLASTPLRAGEPALVDALAKDPQLSTLRTVVEASGLAGTLANAPAITLFAPSNAAFASLPPGAVERMLQPSGQAELAALLNRHVVNDALDLTTLKRKRSVTTVAGLEVRPTLVRGKLRLDDHVRLATHEIRLANGYLIVIDHVLPQ